MAVAILIVNASAEDLPIANQSPKPSLKDSVNEPSSNLHRLVEFLMKTGDTGELGSICRQLGLTGEHLPVVGRDFTISTSSGKERRECTIVFSDNSESGSKRPMCLYIQHKLVARHDGDATYYRMSPDGKLQSVIVSHLKFDDTGKVIRGSAVDTVIDINSPATQKAFKAEFAYWTKDWLNQELKKSASAGSESTQAPTQSVAAPAQAASSASVEAHRVDNSQEVPAARAPGSPY
jgi:hypothetical protein